MNRSNMMKEIRYSDGGLVSFSDSTYAIPVPHQGQSAEDRSKYALSNYSAGIVPPVVPVEDQAGGGQGSINLSERAIRDLEDKWNNANAYYQMWSQGFSGSANPFAAQIAAASNPDVFVTPYNKFLNYNKDYTDSLARYQARNVDFGDWTPPELQRDFAKENLYGSIFGAQVGVPGVEDDIYYTTDYDPATDTVYTTNTVRGYADGGAVGTMNPVNAQTAFQSGNLSFSNDQMKEITNLTVAAIQGQIPNGDEIIKQFIAIFGQEEFQRLVELVQGGSDEGAVSGPGGPTDDMIPAVINGQQPARLSDGEYIIPADVVAGIGDGDTELGNERLDELIDGVRNSAGIA